MAVGDWLHTIEYWVGTLLVEFKILLASGGETREAWKRELMVALGGGDE
jgi:hypothetical protein